MQNFFWFRLVSFGFVWVSFGFRLGFVWVSFGFCLGFVWFWFGFCLGFVWVSFGFAGLFDFSFFNAGLVARRKSEQSRSRARRASSKLLLTGVGRKRKARLCSN